MQSSAIFQRVGIAHVDLVLEADLVVGVLHVDAELLERQHGLAPDVGAGVERREVEVAALVEDLGHAVLGPGVPKVEVLELRPDIEIREAHGLGALERAPKHVARVALVRLPAWRDHVAEHARHALVFRPPGSLANVVASGIAIMSDSSIALKPVIDDPSKPIPPSKASSSSSALIEKLLS